MSWMSSKLLIKYMRMTSPFYTPRKCQKTSYFLMFSRVQNGKIYQMASVLTFILFADKGHVCIAIKTSKFER